MSLLRQQHYMQLSLAKQLIIRVLLMPLQLLPLLLFGTDDTAAGPKLEHSCAG